MEVFAASGIIQSLAAALAFAIWGIYLQRAMQRGASGTSGGVLTGVLLIVCYLPIALWRLRTGVPLPSAAAVGYFMGAGSVTVFLGALVSSHAVLRIGAAHTAAVRLLDPFFALVIAALFLGERVSLRGVAGIALLVGALAVLHAHTEGESGAGVRRAVGVGLLFAVASSVAYTIGSVARKAGLVVYPYPEIAPVLIGLAGLIGGAGSSLFTRARRRVFAAIVGPPARDLWLSSAAGTAGTWFMLAALAVAPVPVVVAVRNLSPWFALFLAPLILGRPLRITLPTLLSFVLLTAGMLLVVFR